MSPPVFLPGGFFETVLPVEPARRCAHGDVDAFHLRIFVKTVAAELTPEAASFVAADRKLRRAVDDAVDPAAAGVHAAYGLHGVFEVGRPHGGRQAELGIVS